MEKDTDDVVITFDKNLSNLIDVLSRIMMKGIEKGLAVLKNGVQLDLEVLLKNLNRFKVCVSKEDNPKEYLMGIFDHLYKNNTSVISSLINDNDSWLLKDDINLIYGINKGKPSKIMINLSDIYKVAISIRDSEKSLHERLPENFKLTEFSKYPFIINYLLSKIFELVNDDDVIKRSLKRQEANLGLGQNNVKRPAIDLKSILDVTSDLAIQYRQGMPGGEQMDPEKIKGAINDTFASPQMNKLFSNLSNMGNSMKPGERPDIGAIFSSLMGGINPAELFKDVQKNIQPVIGNAAAPTPSTEPEKKEIKEAPGGTVVDEEEIIEETEEIVTEEKS